VKADSPETIQQTEQTSPEAATSPANEKPFDFERIGKIGAALAGLLYATGLLTVNAYLYQLGISEFDLLKAKYIYTGALVLSPIVFCTLAPFFAVHMYRSERAKKSDPSPKSRISKFLNPNPGPAGAWQQAVVWPTIPYVVFLGVAVAMDDMRAEYLWKVLIFYIASLMTGIMAYGTFALLTERNPIKRDPSKPPPSRIIAFGGVLFFVGYFAWYLNLFTKNVYPRIPEQFGGGRPRLVQLLVKKEMLEEAKQLGFPASKDRSLSEPVWLLFEDKDVYVLRTPDSRVVQLNRDVFRGLEVLKY
jgi:hypothetical protein